MAASVRAGTRPARKPGRTRAQKAADNRRALFDAAEHIVGLDGYAAATIARITERAGLAQGTFYLYFKSQQDLFDQLLPHTGRKILDYLREQVSGQGDPIAIEERGLRALFEYFVENPGYFRILDEAAIVAPKAYGEHIHNVAIRYTQYLKRSWERGELPDYEERELEVIVHILMAARNYLYLRYALERKGPRMLPDWVIDAYMKFVRNGLNPVLPRGRKPRVKRKPAAGVEES